jgi:ABC-2 type transport system ATP-binding protein
LCDRIAIIDDGEIKAIGTPDELKASLGGDIIDVTVEDEEDHTQTLKDLTNVADVTKNGSEYRVKTLDGDLTMRAVLTKADTERWRIRHISLQKPSMNQVFLHYTGKSLRDTDGSAHTAAPQNRGGR